MNIPNIKTRKEEIGERMKNGEELITILMSGMFGSIRNLPEYNDSDEIVRKANKDINNMDFGDMGSYIDSLSQLVDHWKGLAEHYLENIDHTKYILDDYGYLEELENNENLI